MSIVEQEYNDGTSDKIKNIFENAFSKDNIHQRISEKYYDISILSDNDKKEIISLLVDKIQSDAKTLNWGRELVEITMINFVLLRVCLKIFDLKY